MEEKIEKKREIIAYLNATIEQYTTRTEENKSCRKKEIKQSIFRNLILFGIGGISSIIFKGFAVSGTIIWPIFIVTIPFASMSLLGIPLSIMSDISDFNEYHKIQRKDKKLLKTAITRKAYEEEELENLNETSNYYDEDTIPLENINYGVKYIVDNELDTCASNMHKLIRARKSGKLENFLSERYNVADKESLQMYEAMIKSFLEQKQENKTNFISTGKRLIRK